MLYVSGLDEFRLIYLEFCFINFFTATLFQYFSTIKIPFLWHFNVPLSRNIFKVFLKRNSRMVRWELKQKTVVFWD